MADPQLNAALLVDSLVTTDQRPKFFGKSRLSLKTNAALKQAVEQKLAVSDFEQIVVYFKNPVIGQDPVNKEFFTSDRHKLIATWAR
jgi:hypothetical protein